MELILIKISLLNMAAAELVAVAAVSAATTFSLPDKSLYQNFRKQTTFLPIFSNIKLCY